MILPDPAYEQCRAESLAGAMRRAVVLLYRRPRTLDEDAQLMQAAWAAWETAAIHGEAAQRVSAGLLLAQAQLALGHGQEAIVTAQRVQQVARGSSVATAATVRALAVGAQGWRSLHRPEDAEHLLGIAQTIIETMPDPTERRRLAMLLTDDHEPRI